MDFFLQLAQVFTFKSRIRSAVFRTSMRNLRKQAKELLQAANKVYHYRRDLISAAHLAELTKLVEEVRDLIKSDGKRAQLETALEGLDALLKRIGGKVYPKTFWNDNIEVALVAAIIVIGVRSFFFQPFIIPTNSMYPTYSGMNAVIYEENKRPNPVEKLFRLTTLGARHKALVAKNGGKVQIPIQMSEMGSYRIFVERVRGRKLFLFPTVRARYTIFVDGLAHTIDLPLEFDMVRTMQAVFDFKSGVPRKISGENRFALLELDRTVEKGDDLIRFDITLGDALFVDRMSFHFRQPKVGDPFVFRTDNIPEALAGDVEKYYIKRLAGTGGEVLQIDDGSLLVNGRPRDEVAAFERNAARKGEYGGYRALGRLAPGEEMTIPEGKFVALGDNSGNSRDSRYWGFVPKKSVVGKAFFIYYPFTKRWGAAE